MIRSNGKKYAASLSAIVLAFSLGVTHASDYKVSTAEGPIKIVNLNDLEAQVCMAKAGSIFSLSTYGNKTSEEVAEASATTHFSSSST